MKRITAFLSIIFLSSLCFSQQVLIWNDDFEGTSADWDLTVQTGTNGSDANIWKISDEEGGVTPPGCGVASNGDNTLHVTCQGGFCLGTGAIYNAGDGGAGFFNTETNKRAVYLQPISTVGETNLEFVFDWIGVGQTGSDFTEIEYSIDGGITWSVFWTQVQGPVCGSGQGQWTEETVPLPVAAENQADLRFAFHWQNDNDGNGTDPSFAVNNLRLFADGTATGPTAAFTASSYDICEGDCINLTDNSTGTNISSWSWTFNGATPSASTNQNPSNICYATAGTYDITLTITDDNGTDNITQTINVSACGSGPTANFTASSTSICVGDCINLTDNSTGTNISSWDWTFNGATPATSTSQNPSNICYSVAGTYDISLTVTNSNGTDNATQSITVNTCPGNPPTAAFSVDTTIICAGDCISFTDESTGNPTTWYWTFDTGNPPVSTEQNPSQICFDSVGTFDVTLTVTNPGGTDQITNSITVMPLPTVEGFGDTIIDIGGAAVLNASYTDFGDFFWTPSENLDCDTCLTVIATPYLTTVYYPSLTALNGCTGRDTVYVVVNFEEIVEVPSAFSPNGDNFNDLLFVKGIGITGIEFKIFNRYGQMVFETDDINEGWDGTFNGEPLNQGVFVYTLEFDLVNGESGTREGNITLIK
ncbi:MAG: PKD domain-containing protein [Brumimicrobium sp.]|nr:PKD domain-containing protein [Brumimicrobium sp.]